VVHARKIGIRERLAQDFIVARGLTPDDRIVLEGLQQVADGAHIEPRAPDEVAGTKAR
jgi:hypothetical protein